jgi:ribonucleoside-diphosphate reductase alpha chain
MTEETQNLAHISAEDVVLPPKRQDEPTLEERMSENAYTDIMPARYQRRDADGNLVEEQEDVFERVAKNIALGDLPHLNVRVDVKEDKYRPEFRDEFPDDAEMVEVAEDNVKYIGYDLILDRLPDEARKHLETTRHEFQELMEHLAFMPNTPTLINAGDELQQLSACFVNSPEDDMEDIHDTEKEAALTFQSGGGMGYAFTRLRPYGDTVGSTGGIASGPITFMRTYDQMCKTIAQGGTRRGAQMGVLSVQHPDVIEFIHAKNKDVSLALALGLNDPKDPTSSSFSEALEEARELIDEDGKVPKHLRNAVEQHLSNFNISVGVTHDFMEALDAGEEYTFTNPRTNEPHVATKETKELWSRYGLGHHVEVDEELSVPACELWDHIIEGAYENGEPGVIYLDRVNEEHSFDVEEHPEHEILSTNPCGEQPLEEYEACNLAHINLSTIVDEDAPDWREYHASSLETEDGISDEEALEDTVEMFLHEAVDWEEFDRRIYTGTHFLDNVVTMSDFPIPEIEETVRSLRKVGLGIMGYAQMLVQFGMRYGSEESNLVAQTLMQYINHESKAESHNLAKERGSFAEWEDSKYANPTEYPGWFEEHTGENPFNWKDGFPVRNHNTTTIAPTGTTSMLGNTSGGCEPIYSVANLKNVSQDIQGEDELVQFDDYFLRVLEANGVNVDEVKQEAADYLMGEGFDGAHQLDSVPEAIADLFVTTSDLSGKEHASVQCAFQDGVDSAISKTVNFPASATREDVRDVYEYIYEHGGKGVTVYVEGTRTKQVLSTSSNKTEDGDTDDEEPESASSDDAQTPRPAPRPKVLESTVYPVNTGYGEVNVFVNEDNAGDPFEVFAEIGKSGGFTHSFTEAVGRLTSLALRSGIPPEEVIDQLDGIRSPKTGWHNGGHQIQSIPDAVAYALEQHTEEPESGAENPTPEPAETTVQNRNQTQTDGGALAHGENPECPECGGMALSYTEGCKTCQACGWSECG